MIVTCAYSPELHHKFDRAAFRLMKQTAILVNTSRGGIVNQDHLVEALSSGQIFAAGATNYYKEP